MIGKGVRKVLLGGLLAGTVAIPPLLLAQQSPPKTTPKTSVVLPTLTIRFAGSIGVVMLEPGPEEASLYSCKNYATGSGGGSNVNPSTTVNGACSVKYARGTVVTLTAHGYNGGGGWGGSAIPASDPTVFMGWSGGNCPVAAKGAKPVEQCKLTLVQNAQVTARFEKQD